ncbi:MAG: hypothetical protein N3G80_00705 [Candidatus Micrarchaeota archaeon]|nr:hypothetical protein [Candidatus Micrarchaeota archaeon]
MKKIIAALILLFLMEKGFAWIWQNPLFVDSDLKVVMCNRRPAQDLGWAALSVAAIALGVSINSLTHILGGLLGQKVRDFAKAGVWELAENALLVGIFVLIVAIFQPFAQTNLETARAYAVIIRNTMIADFGMMLGATTLLSLHTSVTPYARLFGKQLGIYVTFQVAPAFKPIYDTLGLLMQLITTAIISWFAHEYMLCFIADSALPILLNAGLFLRALGIKGGGNALIGVSLSLYFVYPFLIVQGGEIISRYIEGEIKTVSGTSSSGLWINCLDRPICCLGNAYPASLDDPRPYIPNGDTSTIEGRLLVEEINKGPLVVRIFSNPTISTGASCIFNTVLGKVYAQFVNALTGPATGEFWSVAKTIGITVATYFILKFLNLNLLAVVFIIPATSFAMHALYQTIYFVFIVSILLPIFNVFITITFAKEIAKVLGTEIDLSSLEKLI